MSTVQAQKQTVSQYKLVPLKRIARLEYGESLEAGKRNEDGDVPVFGSNGEVGFHDTAITLAPVIVIGRKGSFGKISYSDSPCFPIDTTYYIDSRHTSQNLRWLYYQLSILGLDEYSQDTGVPGLSREHAYSKLCHLPSLEQQSNIASYLDRETSKLDQLVEKKQRLIELLQEKRQALITQAVTKGLDPNVPMKDSGIPWLGEVPAHWQVTKLKYCVEPLDHKRIPLSSEERANLERIYPYYGASGIIDFVDRFIFDEDLILIGEDGANLLNRSTRLAFIARGRYWVNNHAHILRPKGNIIFWADRLESIRFDPYITGSAQPKLTLENLLNIDVSFPPDPVEQDSIAKFVESTNNKYDELVSKLSSQIEVIKEYRQALISAAVTGQIDVRQYAADEVAPVSS